MAGTRTKRVSGHITSVQETRFRLVSAGGQGMLFTLAHNAHTSMADLHRFHNAGTHVVVGYTGEPNLASAAAQAVRAEDPHPRRCRDTPSPNLGEGDGG